MRKLLGLSLCVVFIAGCADDRFKLQGSDNVKIPIKMQVKSDTPKDIKQLAADVTAGKWVSFKAITKLLVEKHARESEQLKNKKDPQGELNKMLAAVTPSNVEGNPRQMKIAYENLIQKKTGKEIVYNVDNTNVVDFVTTAKMQCYSGTYLYELIRRNRIGSDFESGREVVIFTPGHVLPGYFASAGESNVLIGIETTESGGGGYQVQLFNKDNKKAYERIIDAQIFALIEITQDYLTNPADVVAQAEKITAEKYGFEPMDSVNVAAADNASGVGQVSAKKVLNASILGFGHADVPPNDQKRSPSGDPDGKLDIVGHAMQSAAGVAVTEAVPLRMVSVGIRSLEDIEFKMYKVPEDLALRLYQCDKKLCEKAVALIKQKSAEDACYGQIVDEIQLKCHSGKVFELLDADQQNTVAPKFQAWHTSVYSFQEHTVLDKTQPASRLKKMIFVIEKSISFN